MSIKNDSAIIFQFKEPFKEPILLIELTYCKAIVAVEALTACTSL